MYGCLFHKALTYLTTGGNTELHGKLSLNLVSSACDEIYEVNTRTQTYMQYVNVLTGFAAH